MNNRIILGTILAIFLMLTVPAVPAVEFNMVKETCESSLLNDLKKGDVKGLKDVLLSVDFSRLKKVIKDVGAKDEVSKLKEQLTDDPAQPLCFPILGIVFYGIILLIILSIIFGIINTIATFIKLIIGAIVATIVGIVGTIVEIVLSIVNVFILLLTFIFKTIVFLFDGTINTIGKIFNLFINIFGIILDIISSIARNLRNALGIFVGLMLDILKLIHDTIFQPDVIRQ